MPCRNTICLFVGFTLLLCEGVLADRPVAEEYQKLVPHRLLPLIHAPQVHAEVGFSEAQIASLETLFSETDGPWFRVRIQSQDKQLDLLDQLEEQVHAWLAKNATPEQRERVAQLELQAQGSRMLLRKDVAAKLALTPDQQQTFAGKARQVAEAESALATAKKRAAPLEELEQNVVSARDHERKAIDEVLSNEQSREVVALLGEQFDTTNLTRIYPMAPELVPVEHWINSKPLTLQQLRGQVVLVHFYAFQCHNCHANQSIYRRWHDQLRKRGVVVVGIQTPETSRESDPAAVRADAAERELDFPIMVDLSKENWKAWGNTMWPTVYVVDKNGYIRHWWQGELNWQGATGDETIERVVEAALQEPVSSSSKAASESRSPSRNGR